MSIRLIHGVQGKGYKSYIYWLKRNNNRYRLQWNEIGLGIALCIWYFEEIDEART